MPVSTPTRTEHTTGRLLAPEVSETVTSRTTLLNVARLEKIRYSAYARVCRPNVREISITSIFIACAESFSHGGVAGWMNDQDVAWCVAQHLPQLRKTGRSSIAASEHDEVRANLACGSKQVFV